MEATDGHIIFESKSLDFGDYLQNSILHQGGTGSDLICGWNLFLYLTDMLNEGVTVLRSQIPAFIENFESFRISSGFGQSLSECVKQSVIIRFDFQSFRRKIKPFFYIHFPVD